MVIGGFMKELKQHIGTSKKTDKEIIDSYQSHFLDGDIGIVFNKYSKEELYEVYVYIKTSDEIASPLLYKISNVRNDLELYYTKLLNFIKNNEPDIIMNRCISEAF
ncbi:MAG: hypothetical protein K6B70_03855 [Clostridia bacterium]|nr:hypothetical protein [Clostridia bacterium]